MTGARRAGRSGAGWSQRPALLALPGAVVLLVGLVVALLPRLDAATVLDEQDALEAFRAGQGAEPAGSGPLPSGPLSSGPASSGMPSSDPASVPAASGAAPDPAAPVPTGTAGPARRAASPAAAAGTGAGPSPQPVPQPSPAPGAAGSREVTPGVYRYATEGHEEVDALGGARHDYPGTTTVTYRRSGCGTSERWQPLQERVGENLVCGGRDGSELRATVQRREFFGRSQTEEYDCSPGTPLLPRDPRPGATTRGTCRSDDSSVAVTTTVVALETLDVGGTAVPVVRLSVTGTLSGSTRGRSDREVWLARADGLLVQVEARTDTDADTEGGTVRYRESYRLRLSSLTPST